MQIEREDKELEAAQSQPGSDAQGRSHQSPRLGECEVCGRRDMDPKSWEVSIRLEGQDILTIGHNHLSGLSDIERYGDVVRSCAEHLMSFIGTGEPGPCFFCGDIECSCPPPPSDHVGGEG